LFIVDSAKAISTMWTYVIEFIDVHLSTA